LPLKARSLLVTTFVTPTAGNPGPIWEVPIANPRNLDCTHYPQPQTGVPYTASAGEC